MIDKFLKYVKTTKSHNTYLTYSRALLSYGTHKFTTEGLLNYITEQQNKGVSPRTIKNKLSVFAVCLKYSGKYNKSLSQVVEGFRAPQKIQPCPSDDDIAAILDAIDNPYRQKIEEASKKYKAIFLFACENGLRLSEICNMQTKDYDGERVVLRQTKNRTDAIVKLSFAAKVAVDEYLLLRIDSAPTLFTCSHGPLPTNTVQQQMKRYMAAAGLGHYHMHSLRRYFANRLDRAGVQLSVVQQCMRHKSISSTMVYINTNAARAEEAVKSVFG